MIDLPHQVVLGQRPVGLLLQQNGVLKVVQQLHRQNSLVWVRVNGWPEEVDEALYVSVLFSGQGIYVLGPFDLILVRLEYFLYAVNFVLDLDAELQTQDLIILVVWLLFIEAIID